MLSAPEPKPKDVEKFRELYRKRFGVELEDYQAQALAKKVVGIIFWQQRLRQSRRYDQTRFDAFSYDELFGRGRKKKRTAHPSTFKEEDNHTLDDPYGGLSRIELEHIMQKDKELLYSRGKQDGPITNEDIHTFKGLKPYKGRVIKFTEDKGISWRYGKIAAYGHWLSDNCPGFFIKEEILPNARRSYCLVVTKWEVDQGFIARPTTMEERAGMVFAYDDGYYRGLEEKLKVSILSRPNNPVSYLLPGFECGPGIGALSDYARIPGYQGKGCLNLAPPNTPPWTLFVNQFSRNLPSWCTPIWLPVELAEIRIPRATQRSFRRFGTANPSFKCKHRIVTWASMNRSTTRRYRLARPKS